MFLQLTFLDARDMSEKLIDYVAKLYFVLMGYPKLCFDNTFSCRKRGGGCKEFLFLATG